MNKNLYRSLILISFIGLNALILFGIGAVWRYMNTGADRTAILQDTSTLEVFYQEVVWDDLAPSPHGFGRELKEAIEKDYLAAWAARNQAFLNNQSDWLKDFYTDKALHKVSDLLTDNKAAGIHVEQINLSHRLQAVYLSADKTLAVIRDLESVWHRRIMQGERSLFSESGNRSYEFLLLLEDGTWRIRNMRELVKDASKSKKEMKQPEEEPDLIEWGLVDRGHWKVDIMDIKGINYYPANAPWSHFSKAYDPRVSESDLKRMQSMGINTVRIFFPYEASGGAEVSVEYLDRLRDFLDRANERSIRVILTLFDFYGDYSVVDWPASLAHLKTLVLACKDHPALIAWDIKNEPDLDFENRSSSLVLAWLKLVQSNLRQWDKEHPITVGWSSPESASNLSQDVDFISFHYYGDPEAFAERLQKATAGLQKPLLLSEFGFSSYSGLWNAYSGSQARQLKYYQRMAKVIEQASLPFMSWTLYDYADIPRQVVGRAPWKRNPQRRFGLLEVDGTVKPAGKAYSKLLQQ